MVGDHELEPIHPSYWNMRFIQNIFKVQDHWVNPPRKKWLQIETCLLGSMLTYDHLGQVTWIVNSKHIWPVTISSTMGLPSKLINPTSHHQAMVILEEDTRGWLWNPGLVDSYSRLCGLYPTHNKNMCASKNWILSFLQGSVGTDFKNLVENHHRLP